MFGRATSSGKSPTCWQTRSKGAIDLKKAKAARKTSKRREWAKADLIELKAKARTPVLKISKLTKRSVGALRQKALHLGIGLGHRR
jgi:hypothetical protein